MHSRIDLHMHSTASDGTDSPQKLAEKVSALGIDVFALTDHDTATGFEQLAGKLPGGGRLIPGIEFSCRAETGDCHLLGYCCDTMHPAFRSAVAEGAERRQARLEKRLDFLKGQNIIFPQEEIERLHLFPGAGKPHLAELMVKYHYAPDREEAFLGTLAHCHVKGGKISAKTAIRAVLDSGGIPVWAHPLSGSNQSKIGRAQFEQMLEELIPYGLCGLECYYSQYPMELCSRLADAARIHHLLVSGGSDYHGLNKSIPPGILNAEGDVIPVERLTILEALLSR